MIEEKQLQEWERLCDKDSLCKYVFEDFGIVLPQQSKQLTYAFADKALEIIPQLIARVRELEKEADWLADIADYYCGQDSKFCMRRCPLKSKDFRTCEVWCSTETSPELWREAARKATKVSQ